VTHTMASSIMGGGGCGGAGMLPPMVLCVNA